MSVRRLALWGLLALLPAAGAARAAEADEQAAADERLLREARVAVTDGALLEFLRQRSLTDDDRAKLDAIVRRLGSAVYEERERASAALAARGSPALPFLRRALNDADAEVRRRARRCLEEIERGPGSALPAAAVRLLARRRPAGALEVLLTYAPFADDEFVEDEVLAALAALGLRGGKAAPPLTDALADAQAPRRAAAAYAVGRSPDPAQRDAAARLLSDADPAVRLRAAQALVAGRDRRGVPALIDLLADAPAERASKAEELLLRLAGELAPEASAGAGTPEERKRWRETWAGWWRERGPKVDLARLDEATPYLGLTLVPEMHGNKVWECGKDGKVRWELTGLSQPRDARVLPGGRVLIAEVTAGLVTERDRKGKLLWSHKVQDPAYVERLANGNTFVGTHNRAFEVTPAGKEIVVYQSEAGFFIHSMHRKANGNLVCLSMTGCVREVNRAGKVVCTFQLDNNGRNWCGVQGLPGGRYLAVDYNQGHVLELDAKGKTQWECKVQGATYAVRRPTGTTLICSFGGQRVVEVNRAGKVVWEKKVASMPWRVHSR
jgi:HEAT repeat protein